MAEASSKHQYKVHRKQIDRQLPVEIALCGRPLYRMKNPLVTEDDEQVTCLKCLDELTKA